MKKEKRTATTVKLSDFLYDEFKILGIRHKLTLQDFVEKCVTLYVSNEPHSSSFRDLINQFQPIELPKTESRLDVLSSTGSFTLHI